MLFGTSRLFDSSFLWENVGWEGKLRGARKVFWVIGGGRGNLDVVYIRNVKIWESVLISCVCCALRFFESVLLPSCHVDYGLTDEIEICLRSPLFI